MLKDNGKIKQSRARAPTCSTARFFYTLFISAFQANFLNPAGRMQLRQATRLLFQFVFPQYICSRAAHKTPSTDFPLNPKLTKNLFELRRDFESSRF